MDDPEARRIPARAAAFDVRFVALHWLLAALIVGAFLTGLYMVELVFSPLRFRLYNWHKWVGMLVLALSAARLGWRLTLHRSTPLPPGIPSWQLAAARGTHLAFYALFLIVPLLGWLYTSAVGVPVIWFGWLALPDLTPLNKPFGDQVLKPLHSASAYLLAALVVLHTAAALKHQLIDRDRLLSDMWPWWPGRGRP
jgi:cytochrome b561